MSYRLTSSVFLAIEHRISSVFLLRYPSYPGRGRLWRKRASEPRLFIRTLPKQLARVRHSERGRISGIGAVPCAEPFDVDEIACAHFVARPAAPDQRVNAEQLDRPALDVAVVVFGVDEEPGVGICPFDSRDRARQFDGPVDIELGGKRVVRYGGHGRQQPRRTEEN